MYRPKARLPAGKVCCRRRAEQERLEQGRKFKRREERAVLMSEKVSTPARPVVVMTARVREREGAGEPTASSTVSVILHWGRCWSFQKAGPLSRSSSKVARGRGQFDRVWFASPQREHWSATRRSQSFLRSDWSLYSLYTSLSGLPFFWGREPLWSKALSAEPVSGLPSIGTNVFAATLPVVLAC